MLNFCAGRGRGKPYRLRDWSQGICDCYGFFHRNLGDHGAQREDNDAMFSRGIHNSFKFLPTQSTSLVKVPSMSYAAIFVTFPKNLSAKAVKWTVNTLRLWSQKLVIYMKMSPRKKQMGTGGWTKLWRCVSVCRIEAWTEIQYGCEKKFTLKQSCSKACLLKDIGFCAIKKML